MQQSRMTWCFCDLLPCCAQFFNWRDIAVDLSNLKENIWVALPIRVFHFSAWKRQNKEETGDRMYGELAPCLLWRPWQPQLLPLETTCLFILLSKRIHHVETLNSFSKRKTWWLFFFLSLIICYCLICEPFEGRQTRNVTLCPPQHNTLPGPPLLHHNQWEDWESGHVIWECNSAGFMWEKTESHRT